MTYVGYRKYLGESRVNPPSTLVWLHECGGGCARVAFCFRAVIAGIATNQRVPPNDCVGCAQTASAGETVFGSREPDGRGVAAAGQWPFLVRPGLGSGSSLPPRSVHRHRQQSAGTQGWVNFPYCRPGRPPPYTAPRPGAAIFRNVLSLLDRDRVAEALAEPGLAGQSQGAAAKAGAMAGAGQDHGLAETVAKGRDVGVPGTCRPILNAVFSVMLDSMVYGLGTLAAG